MPIEIVTDRSALPSTAKRWRCDELAQLLGEDGPFLDVGLGQDQHEFLAAIAADHVARPQVGPDGLGDAAQDDVARGVAVGVVDGLEVVDVDEGDRQRALVASGALDLGEEGAQQGAPIDDAGQAVDRRPVVGLRQGGGDAVDGPPEPPLEAVAPSRHGDRVVAGGDPLGGLHETPEPDAHQEVQRARRDRHADGRRGHRSDHGTAHGIDPGGRDLRDRDEEDPECDRSRKRQDPKQAHHLSKARAEARFGGVTSSTGHGSPVVPMHPRTTLERGTIGPPSARLTGGPWTTSLRAASPLLYSPGPSRRRGSAREPGGQRSRFTGASVVP